MSALAAEVMAQPEPERLGYALDLMACYLDPVPEFFDAVHDLGLRLPASDARVLQMLDRRRGRFVSADALLAAAMGSRPLDDWPTAQTVQARICRLRGCLSRARLPVSIETWPGVGYRLEAPAHFRFLGGAT